MDVSAIAGVASDFGVPGIAAFLLWQGARYWRATRETASMIRHVGNALRKQGVPESDIRAVVLGVAASAFCERRGHNLRTG